MNQEEVQPKLIEAIHQVLELSGHTSTVITADTMPLKDLPGFDSLNAVEAITNFCDISGIEVDGDVNLFINEETGHPLRIREIADRIQKALKMKGGKKNG